MSSDDLRARMRAVFSARLSKSEKTVLRGYSVDSATKNGVTVASICNTTFPNKNKDVTPLHPVSANRGLSCKVEIVELPQAQRYRKVFAHLQLKPPALVPVERWQQCVRDGSRFLAKWGDQAEALGWSSADLFGLHEIPAKPHPSYQRLSRYDCTGLIWLLEGRPVVALTADTASIRNPKTGNVTVYRKLNKPALGPVGDDFGDLG